MLMKPIRERGRLAKLAVSPLTARRSGERLEAQGDGATSTRCVPTVNATLAIPYGGHWLPICISSLRTRRPNPIQSSLPRHLALRWTRKSKRSWLAGVT